MIVENWKVNLLNNKYLIKLIIEIVKNYIITENNKIIIYFKSIIRKMINILNIKIEENIKNVTLNNI